MSNTNTMNCSRRQPSEESSVVSTKKPCSEKILQAKRLILKHLFLISHNNSWRLAQKTKLTDIHIIFIFEGVSSDIVDYNPSDKMIACNHEYKMYTFTLTFSPQLTKFSIMYKTTLLCHCWNFLEIHVFTVIH